MNPRYVFYDHLRPLIAELQRIADEDNRRTMVFMPPRHGKSETVSRLFPAYYLYRHPERWAGLNSYAAELAYTMSRTARDNYIRAGGVVSDAAGAVHHWETSAGGGLWAAGVGGPITGKGFHLGIIDDPIKNAEEAASETIRRKQKDWYSSTFYTRAEPNASIVIVQTRWHEDDLSGWLLQMEEDEPEGWNVIVMPAISADGRALCPERYDLPALERIKRKIGSYYWGALYQQTPTADEGNMWKREWIKVYDTLPENVSAMGYDWDTAYTTDERNAANAYVKSGSDPAGNIYVDDCDWRWCETPELVAWMKSLGGPHYIEAKASGKSAKQFLDREKIYAVEVTVKSDKVARTRDAMPVAESGKLYVRRAILGRLLDDDRQGILKFPNGAYQDLNDALTQAVARHTGGHVTGFISLFGKKR